MKKLSEIKGEEALDILADLIEPLSEFSLDKKFVSLVRSKNMIPAAKRALKGHKKAVLTVLALLENEDPKTYAPSIIHIPAMIVELLNDPDFIALFPSVETVTSSGSAMESTEETEEE